MKRYTKYIYSKGNYLIRNFIMCSVETKVKLFQTFCSSIYCGHLWSNFTSRELHRVKVSFNNVYRFLFNIRRGASISASVILQGLDSFPVLLRKYCNSFRSRLFNCDNIYVSTLVNSVFFNTTSSLFSTWNHYLFCFNST